MVILVVSNKAAGSPYVNSQNDVFDLRRCFGESAVGLCPGVSVVHVVKLDYIGASLHTLLISGRNYLVLGQTEKN